jgi:prephenate dehydrogenase
MAKEKQIDFSIIGAGRFGIFWGAHISKFHRVSFFDTIDDKRKDTEQFGIWESFESCLRKDFIFLTIPIGRLPGFLKNNSSKFQPGTVLVDCASVKLPVIEWFEKYLPQEIYYVASHPLFGPDSAREGLDGHTITLIPGRIPFHKYNTLVHLFSELMHLTVINLSPDEHDRLMAYNLSLVHHLGRTFHDMQIYKLPLMMSGLSNINRISQVVMNDSQELFHDFYRFNPHSEVVRNKFIEIFDKISSMISKNNKL